MVDTCMNNGSAIVTNTMIIQSARFLDDPSSRYSRIERFFDLCSLIEAVILRNHLLTLEGDIANCDDYSSLRLIVELKKAGILIDNAIPLNYIGIQKELLSVVGSGQIFSQVDGREIRFHIEKMIPEVFPEINKDVFYRSEWRAMQRHFFMLALERIDTQFLPMGADNVFSFFRNEDFLEFTKGTGGSERGAYILRTYIYSKMAREHKLAFMPDYPRIPFLSSILNQYYENVVTKSYNVLSQKLNCEAEEFLEDARPLGLPIPPFTSLVLNDCKSPEDLPRVLLKFRDEFSNLRESLTTLESILINSTNIRDRIKARKHVEAVFASAGRKYSESGYTNFKSLFDFSGDLIAPIFDWANPTSYSTNLVTKPLDWIRDWWFRRPLAQFFDLANQFRSISEYNTLAKRVFKIDFTDEEIIDFTKTQYALNRLFSEKK